MKYKNVFITKEIDENLLRSFLDFVIDLFTKYDIEKTNISFRYAWGSFIGDWEYFKIDVRNIKTEIELAENRQLGRLGEDDLFLFIEKYDTELQFCHHSDLHLGFNDENVFVKDILGFWSRYHITYSK